MRGLVLLDEHAQRRDQLWYVAHPVHPTSDDVSAFRAREDELLAQERKRYGSLGIIIRQTDDDIKRIIIRDNLVNAKEWRARLARRFPTITFIAPWIVALDGGGDDDLDPVQRARGIRDCCRTVRVCSGIVLVGGRVSWGMAEEARYAWSTVDLTDLGRSPPPPL